MEHIYNQDVNGLKKVKKTTKYFLNLEKQHSTNNRISCIKTDNNVEVYKSADILQEGVKFYKNLYKQRYCNLADIDMYLNEIVTNSVLTEVEADICEGIITAEECLLIIKSMSNNKSPGLDGLPAEFYTHFWDVCKKLVVDSFNEAFLVGELSETHKQIIISLIFKKDDRKLFKNYRPISLSNVDYKILAFVLAKRLQKVISKLISPEQVAYINSRYIGQNVRLLLDIIDYAEKHNKPGVLLFLDFEKAFDSLNWNFIHACLKKMGFKNDFCRWIRIIYMDPKAFLKINGFLSEVINFERGIRQGCPLSCLIFIICTEFMALHLKQNDNIKGFEINTTEKSDKIR